MHANPKTQGIAILSSAGAVLALLTSPASAAIRTVSTKPTLSSLAPGESVLYDDKSCPAGMIAKFTKAKNRAQMGKKCIHK